MKKIQIQAVFILFMCVFIIISCQTTPSVPTGNRMIRIAKLEIDSAQLDNYKVFLKEEIEASVKVEPGVLTLYSVFEKNKPTHVTVFEIYADTADYKSHIQTPHFQKYKVGTKEMVKSLELLDVMPIALAAK